MVLLDGRNDVVPGTQKLVSRSCQDQGNGKGERKCAPLGLVRCRTLLGGEFRETLGG